MYLFIANVKNNDALEQNDDGDDYIFGLFAGVTHLFGINNINMSLFGR